MPEDQSTGDRILHGLKGLLTRVGPFEYHVLFGQPHQGLDDFGKSVDKPAIKVAEANKRLDLFEGSRDYQRN